MSCSVAARKWQKQYRVHWKRREIGIGLCQNRRSRFGSGAAIQQWTIVFPVGTISENRWCSLFKSHCCCKILWPSSNDQWHSRLLICLNGTTDTETNSVSTIVIVSDVINSFLLTSLTSLVLTKGGHHDDNTFTVSCRKRDGNTAEQNGDRCH